MSKGIFITGTGTDVGKTYVTGLIIKKMRDSKVNCGYYKAALSGAREQFGKLIPGDALYVKNTAKINENIDNMVSYIYKSEASPHLASKLEGNALNIDKVLDDYLRLLNKYNYLTVEGSGGIICPIRYDNKKIMLEDIIKKLNLSTIVVADAGLGTINDTVLTISYMRNINLRVKGIIMNNYDENNILHNDNRFMIEQLTNIPVIAFVKKGDSELDIDLDKLINLYE